MVGAPSGEGRTPIFSRIAGEFEAPSDYRSIAGPAVVLGIRGDLAVGAGASLGLEASPALATVPRGCSVRVSGHTAYEALAVGVPRGFRRCLEAHASGDVKARASDPVPTEARTHERAQTRALSRCRSGDALESGTGARGEGDDALCDIVESRAFVAPLSRLAERGLRSAFLRLEEEGRESRAFSGSMAELLGTEILIEALRELIRSAGVSRNLEFRDFAPFGGIDSGDGRPDRVSLEGAPLVGADSGDAKLGDRRTGGPWKIEDVVRYIEERYSESFSLDFFVSRCAMNTSDFSRRFKEKTGCPLFEYVNRQRIRRACSLLRDGDMPIVDVAFDVGYNNLSFFNRYFMRIMRTTPRDFRAFSRRS